MDNYTIYENTYAKWRKVYDSQLGLCDRKITKNMWIAPIKVYT